MLDLWERQAELEWESVALGQQRYEAALDGQGQSAVSAGASQVVRALPALAAAVDSFVNSEATRTAAGRKHTALPYLLNILPEQAAYLTLRYVIDGAAERRPLAALAIDLGTAVEDHCNLVTLKSEAPRLFRKVMDQVEASSSPRHRTGVLRHVIKKYAQKPLSWSKADKLLLGTKLVELLQQTVGLVEVRVDNEGRHQSRARVHFTEQAAGWFADANERASFWSPVHLPMVVPPRDWTSPFHGGYITKAIRRAFLVQSHLQFALDELKNVDMPNVYAAVNAIQRTPWKINERVLGVMREAWRAGGRYEPLFADADLALPPRPTTVPKDVDADKLTAEQREDLTAWKIRAANVYEHNNAQRSKRIAVSKTLTTAERFAEYERIWFPHYLDFRGRIYPFASFLTPQSGDVGKSLLEFAEGRPLGERGLFWLKVHIANLFGVDKVSFAERTKWVNDNLDALLRSATVPLEEEFWHRADSPWCALAACMELAGALVAGPDYVSHLPIAMDGSCSGLQHYSAMLRDPVGGAAVNLVPAEKPGDIYTMVAKRAQAVVDRSLEENAKPWKGGKVVRKIAKQPTMTICYAATRYGMQGQIEKAIRDLGGAEYLGGADPREAAQWMSHVVWDAIGETVVAAKDAMDFLKQIAKLASEAGLPIRWTAPSGFHVVQAYREVEGVQVNAFYQGLRMRLTYQKDGERLDPRRQASGVAPNFVHSLDSAHLMATVNLGRENGLEHWACIHDSFGVHAADVDVLHACIREAFVEQYTPCVLDRLREEIVQQLEPVRPDLALAVPAVPPKGTLDLAAILDAPYFFA